MQKNMPYFTLKLTLFLGLFLFSACQDEAPKIDVADASFRELRSGLKNDLLAKVRQFKLVHSSGRILDTVLLLSPKQQEIGLSGVQPGEFQGHEAALFWYDTDSQKRFWMPDTYFDLDIIFLDKDLKIVAIDRDMKAHPGRNEPPNIMFSSIVYARHVLEIKADSELSDVIKIGDQFQVMSPLTLSQIESEIHQQR